MFYGCEILTIRKCEAMETWIWGKMDKTLWVERKTNEQVLKYIKEEKDTIYRTHIKREN
jgi:hypothetical protein